MTKAKRGETGGESPSRLIDARIAELGDWRRASAGPDSEN